ncbi:MAG: HAD-IA family hydrolase [Microgenomates group bacterium]
MSKISFVYFDVGGVAIQDFSDSPKWESMMDVMGIPNPRREEFDQLYHEYDTQFCLGTHEDTILPQIAAQFGLTLPEGFSMRRYFIDHFDSNPDLWPIVTQLKHSMKLGLLTDQYPGMLKQIFDKKILPPVSWDVIIDSTEVGARKPSPTIYQVAQAKSDVPAAEILFIDNREKNLVPARALGWQTFLYDSSNYDQANRDLYATILSC